MATVSYQTRTIPVMSGDGRGTQYKNVIEALVEMCPPLEIVETLTDTNSIYKARLQFDKSDDCFLYVENTDNAAFYLHMRQQRLRDGAYYDTYAASGVSFNSTATSFIVEVGNVANAYFSFKIKATNSAGSIITLRDAALISAVSRATGARLVGFDYYTSKLYLSTSDRNSPNFMFFNDDTETVEKISFDAHCAHAAAARYSLLPKSLDGFEHVLTPIAEHAGTATKSFFNLSFNGTKIYLLENAGGVVTAANGTEALIDGMRIPAIDGVFYVPIEIA